MNKNIVPFFIYKLTTSDGLEGLVVLLRREVVNAQFG